MKTSDTIKDKLGRVLVESIYDDAISYFQLILKNQTPWNRDEALSLTILKLDNEERFQLETYIKKLIASNIFGFLNLFEENEEFKLIHQVEGKQTNILELSEMLKSELHGKDGWIERFSIFSEKNKK